MLKKIANILFRNLGLKILALVISIVLWYVVLNINDPMISKSFSCAVTVENSEAVASMGKTYEIVDGSTAYFNVRAARSIMKNLSATDFRAVADMEKLQDLTYVPIDVTATRYAGQVEIIKRTQNMEISTEDLMRSQYIISPSYEGTPAEGSVVGSISVSPNVLKVSGPVSIVQEIDKVGATIHVDGIATDISDSVIPTIYAKDGSTIDTTKLTFNLTSVIVRAEILSTKEVPLSFETKGTPAEGCVVQEISASSESLAVMGDSVDLNALSEIKIPSELLDITDMNKDFTTTVDVTPYLPDAVHLVDASLRNVTVHVTIVSPITKSYRIYEENVRFTGLPKGAEAEIAPSEIMVDVKGLPEDMEELKATDLHAEIDVTGMSNGLHEVTLTFDLDPEKYQVVEPVKVQIDLRRTR